MLTLKNERKETIYKYDMDLSEEDAKILKEYALKRIADDDEALCNYAAVKLLEDYIKNLDNKNKVKKNVKKNVKKGSNANKSKR